MQSNSQLQKEFMNNHHTNVSSTPLTEYSVPQESPLVTSNFKYQNDPNQLMNSNHLKNENFNSTNTRRISQNQDLLNSDISYSQSRGYAKNANQPKTNEYNKTQQNNLNKNFMDINKRATDEYVSQEYGAEKVQHNPMGVSRSSRRSSSQNNYNRYSNRLYY